jgi:hypothetical protein
MQRMKSTHSADEYVRLSACFISEATQLITMKFVTWWTFKFRYESSLFFDKLNNY